ncbi:MAG TPA: DivIVA domain-containing protein [Acidimicrobiia bacterium]
MAPEVTPDSVRDAKFRTVIRGVDAAAVAQFQEQVAAKIAELQEQNERLTARLGEFADRDLKSEFEVVGNEVTAVLEAAREAAESMRERASADSARWRAEAMAESEEARKDARSDAEALRGDAWTVGTEMLSQAVVESNRLSKQAERDAITITGEAERDAHRLVSNARREAEDLVRTAAMDAEKLNTGATKAHDEMIEQARRQSEASQERTQALEQRREELMAELEGVRTTLSHLEGTLEAKRDDLKLSRTTDSSVRVVPSSPVPPPASSDVPTDWVPGETVRVVRGDEPPAEATRRPEPEPAPIAEVPTVKVIPAAPPSRNEDEEANRDTAPEPVASEETQNGVVVAEAEPEVREPAPPSAPPPSGPDDVGELFASLRHPGETAVVPPSSGVGPADREPTTSEAPPPDVPASQAPIRVSESVLEERDALLLPITNRALRGIKKAITEAQNIALDGLRTRSDWKPSKPQLTTTLKADLIALWSESFSAGHDMAEAMAGEKLKRPPTPTSDPSGDFVAALVDALKSELISAGDGQRERQSGASKVFRAWRTDEAERRIRQLALRAYHIGLVGSAAGRTVEWVASGIPCSSCREAASEAANHLPPVHAGCECTIAIAS